MTFDRYHLYAQAVAGRNAAILATAVIVWSVLMLIHLVREVRSDADRITGAAGVVIFYVSLLGLAVYYLRWSAAH